jgi:hypothetical protein
MVPSAQADGAEAADDIGEEVEEVEGAVVREEALDDLGADAEDEGADDEAQVQRAPARGIGDPVKCEREEEEGDEVQEFVVRLELSWDRGRGVVREEADVAGEEEDEGECAWDG